MQVSKQTKKDPTIFITSGEWNALRYRKNTSVKLLIRSAKKKKTAQADSTSRRSYTYTTRTAYRGKTNVTESAKKYFRILLTSVEDWFGLLSTRRQVWGSVIQKRGVNIQIGVNCMRGMKSRNTLTVFLEWRAIMLEETAHGNIWRARSACRECIICMLITAQEQVVTAQHQRQLTVMCLIKSSILVFTNVRRIDAMSVLLKKIIIQVVSDEYKVHIELKEASHLIKANIFKKLQSTPEMAAAVFDLEEILPCPSSSHAFITKESLMYDYRDGQGFCHIRSEVEALRGSNEIVSCVDNYLKRPKEQSI
ncbi:hypothetical protein PoB_000260400 [Plakobranchus ocellatus]|uniref:Uncharacterized protein n=1 Tax=Plakobranchus ocellatus TaxID=259542 RepID=A0AAV3Y1K5_9GAST|nr:hypothetical protein PoB_000260400 [Plakobranchus ocellatus]